MNKILAFTCIVFIGCINLSSVSAQEQGIRYVDSDGDGFADNLPDRDFDGIPDNLDPDDTIVSPTNSSIDSRKDFQKRMSFKNRFQRFYQFRRKLAYQTDMRNFSRNYFRLRTDSYDGRSDRRSADRFRRLGSR